MISSTLSTQLDTIQEDGSGSNTTTAMAQKNVAKRKKKVVSFAIVVKAKKVQHHNDMSPDEKEYIWYDDEDLIRIHVENELIITRAVIENQLQDDEETRTTTRGLERQIQEKATSLGKKTTSIRKLNVKVECFNILMEQQQGCCPQGLAEKAMECSLPNVLAARSTGVHDELTARDIYNQSSSSSDNTNNKKKQLLLLGDTQECYNRATNLRDRRRQRMRQIACKAA